MHRMFLPALSCSAMALLAACSPTQIAKVQSGEQRVVAAGQLFCAQATQTGPLVIALADSIGVPVVVTGATASSVSAACKVVDAIPVSPPADPASAPVVAANVAPLVPASAQKG
jgi:hypothetical protein